MPDVATIQTATPNRTSGFIGNVFNYFAADKQDTESLSSEDASDQELYDMLENGFARESVTHECLTPRDGGDAQQQFYIKRDGKKYFEMYQEGSQKFMLSAKRIGDDFWISPYEMPDHSEAGDDTHEVRQCAVLRRKGNCYRLMLTQDCDACDAIKNSDRPNCGWDINVQGSPHTRVERQVLAEIVHSTTYLEEADMTLRDLRAVVPPMRDDDPAVRVPWLPIHARPIDRSDSDSSEHEEMEPLRLQTKLPRWSDRTGCLTQKFESNRVKKSSSKNFMLNHDYDLNAGKSVLQFGKKRKGTYVLDHRYPLAPLQAFGICLSMCNWIGD